MPSDLINIMIPTLNEAHHITEAVENASKVGHVFVLDSLSTDGTQELAREAGATVIEHEWEGYAGQKNWGLNNLPWTGQWVFILDADERIPRPLREELISIAESDPDVAGYYVNRLLIFMGHAVRHGALYPQWNLRFFRLGKAWYEDRLVHEHMIVDGNRDYLKEHMIHIRRENMTQYLDKHVHYANLESDEWLKMWLGQESGTQVDKLFKDMLRYRQWIRRYVWPHTPFRPLIRFLHMYVFRMGFLDGKAGWHLALLMASYEYMISMLYREKKFDARQSNK